MKTIEVYKTNVQNSIQGKHLVYALHRKFPEYSANFDLNDCDKILRIESRRARIEDENIISLMQSFGFMAEPLPD